MQKTPKAEIKRAPNREIVDDQVIDEILRQAKICHVAFIDEGLPYCIPTAFARYGNDILLHGSVGSRMLNVLGKGEMACVTVTHLDGMVLARSAFHHSMNYRSVCIFGHGSFAEKDEKEALLNQVTEHLVPGRNAFARGPSPAELKQTALVKIPMERVSAKMRQGPPSDDEADMNLEIWAGVVPYEVSSGQPVPDEKTGPIMEVPKHVLKL